jgi:hypothetical protein
MPSDDADTISVIVGGCQMGKLQVNQSGSGPVREEARLSDTSSALDRWHSRTDPLPQKNVLPGHAKPCGVTRAVQITIR